MKKNLKFLFLFTLIIATFSCSNCPSDIHLGSAFLSEESKRFMAYDDGPVSISYVNSKGNIIELHSDDKNRYNVYDRIVATPCFKDFTEQTNYVLSTEFGEVNIFNDSIDIGIRIDLTILNNFTSSYDIDTNWVETVEYNFSTDELNGKFGVLVISDYRDKKYNGINIESFKFYESKKIVDRVFYGVYTSKYNEQFYFNKSYGVVGFMYDDILYRLLDY